MAAPTAPLLDLTVSIDRPFIAVNGVNYDIRTAGDLTIGEYKSLWSLAPQLSTLLAKTDATKEQDAARSRMLDDVCRLALMAPDEVHKSLGDVNRMKIFGVFTSLLFPSAAQARATRGAAKGKGGTRSSRGSRGSTAARRATGSPKSPSAPSART